LYKEAHVTDRTGEQFGNYQLLRLLGYGGFADVYLGEHLHLGTNAAIKVLHTRLGGPALKTFRTEARTIARLEHPHIVRVLDFGMEGAFPYLVMDYAPNGTLRHRHQKGTRLPLQTVLFYVEAIADALQYAHDERLIHRDVKPENMLVGRRGMILLSDFGIAVTAHQTHSMSLQNEAGTVLYMAPEQTQRRARPASDQYALAAVVYEWLSGSPPFSGNSTVEIAMKHLSEQPPDLSTQLPSLSPEVSQVVMKALAKDPQQRFLQVQDFAIALTEAGRREQRQEGTDDLPGKNYVLLPTAPKELSSPTVLRNASPQTLFPSEQKVSTVQVTSRRRNIFWFFAASLSMLVLVALLGGLLFLTHGNDLRYGLPRTFQIDAVVGHRGDSATHPSHFIAINLNEQAVIIELPAGNAAAARLYLVSIPAGSGNELAPITLEFRDVNGDGKPDMIVHIHLASGDQMHVFVNDGTTFKPASSSSVNPTTLMEPWLEPIVIGEHSFVSRLTFSSLRRYITGLHVD
jgi:serine/threonine protein kinase